MPALLQLLIILIVTGLGCQVATYMVPPGGPRAIVTVAIAGLGVAALLHRAGTLGLLGV